MLATEIWHTFDRDRKLLETQYASPAWDEESGWSPSRLKEEAAQLVQAAGAQPHILTKARLFELIMLHGRIAVDARDWYADHLLHGYWVMKLRDSWKNELNQTLLAEAYKKTVIAHQVGAYHAGPNFSHTAPDWERMITLGPAGLLDHIRATRQMRDAAGNLSASERDFYDALEIVYTAFQHFIVRLAEGAEKQAALHPEEAERMLITAGSLRHIAERPPETLQEALQLAYLCHELMEMEGENVRSMGMFDRLYYRFYRSDLQQGLRTREQEKELIKYFFIKFFAKTGGKWFGKNFVFGGVDENGDDVTNPLTYAALEAYEEMQTVDPKLSIRLHKGTPPALLRQVAASIRKGCNSFVLVNDKTGLAALQKRGVPYEDACNYILMGCYEPAILGKEVPCSGSEWVSAVKAVERAIFNGVDLITGKQNGPRSGDADSFTSFEEFYTAYKTQLQHYLAESMDVQVEYERYWKEMNTSPLLSGTMAECVANGRDISEGGAKYNNTGCCIAGLASAVDSLLAVKELVFERREITLSTLGQTLHNDWADNELLRRKVLHLRTKFGNNLPEPDALMCDISDFMGQIINSRQNERGGRFCAAINSVNHYMLLGKGTAALPDGRKAGTPLSKNLNANVGMDRAGVTALINSVTKIDFTEFPNGSVLDIMLHPSAVQGEEGLVALESLIHGYFARGGFGIQVNIFDVNTLRAAQQHPEEYATLQVRVCGWNVYFVNLNPIEQEIFIQQAEQLSA